MKNKYTEKMYLCLYGVVRFDESLKRERFGGGAMICNAVDDLQANGKALKECYERYPADQGYYGHSLMNVTEIDVLALIVSCLHLKIVTLNHIRAAFIASKENTK